MSWYIALLFNFLSSLTALAGFFIGVSVGLVSQQANGWMLAVAAGTFLYVSMVDLVRGEREGKGGEGGRREGEGKEEDCGEGARGRRLKRERNITMAKVI